VLAVLALVPWVIAVSSGVQDRSSYANLLFVAMTLAIVAVNLFSTGTVFNYIVSLFHRRPIRQGLFGRPVFRKPLEQRFGTIGVGLFIVGIVLFAAAILFPAGTEPAWFLLVPSAMFVMTGIQLGTSWLLVHLLTELSKRDLKVQADLGANTNPLEDDTIVLRDNTPAVV
jgi:sterol desaturase/sphingolipid hydroxylase (fatty acid hydroxylase superfamily)